MVKIDMDIARDVLPYFIYKRIKLEHFREYFSFQIAYGFGYWLRSVRVKYPELSPALSDILGVLAGTEKQSPKLNIEFFDNANFKARQPAPFSVDLISSPGKDRCYSYAAPSPVDQDGYGLNFSAVPAVQSISNLNFLYRYGDIIRIDITGQETQSGQWTPDYLDLLLIGYYVPQKSFEMYGGRE